MWTIPFKKKKEKFTPFPFHDLGKCSEFIHHHDNIYSKRRMHEPSEPKLNFNQYSVKASYKTRKGIFLMQIEHQSMSNTFPVEFSFTQGKLTVENLYLKAINQLKERYILNKWAESEKKILVIQTVESKVQNIPLSWIKSMKDSNDWTLLRLHVKKDVFIDEATG